ncbi:pollen-specific leucine-rich repeat extensin-like protein 1 [Austrofundulus limnaeus]|uniref:Pollen-specific leucine-rich repeat extensin-like protein 1 n=1 Tax=Austrofundulus limnaeus TaxID=52670 RepID=A0A2I4CYD1_AUSLI|nr:PREDICTED: pollen-specific leucine-rich repeat extensin-like protein 1 [Austrofundulus limnaeus]
MKVQLVLPLTILTSAMLVGFVKIRRKEVEKQEKLSRFQDIKIRVTSEVLQEYQNDQIEGQKHVEKAQSDTKSMEEEVDMLQTKADKTKGDADICLGAKKSDADQLAASETNLNNVKEESQKEMSDLKREVDELKKQLADRSPVCNVLKETPDPIKTMCGIKDEPKPKEEEAPKPEEKKVEPPKPEEKKVEPPKPEEKKVEPPKPEEKKAEPPKPEEKKAEPPK